MREHRIGYAIPAVPIYTLNQVFCRLFTALPILYSTYTLGEIVNKHASISIPFLYVSV